MYNIIHVMCISVCIYSVVVCILTGTLCLLCLKTLPCARMLVRVCPMNDKVDDNKVGVNTLVEDCGSGCIVVEK